MIFSPSPLKTQGPFQSSWHGITPLLCNDICVSLNTLKEHESFKGRSVLCVVITPGMQELPPVPSMLLQVSCCKCITYVIISVLLSLLILSLPLLVQTACRRDANLKRFRFEECMIFINITGSSFPIGPSKVGTFPSSVPISNASQPQ